MPDFDIDRYERLLTRFASNPDRELGELDAKQVGQRWLMDHCGSTLFGGGPFHSLAAWTDDKLFINDRPISEATLLREAEQLLAEITDVARTPHWASLDPDSTRDLAATAMTALVRYLRALPATYTAIAGRVYADIDDDPASEPDLSETEAKTIAAGWASDNYFPELAAWANASDADATDAVVDFAVLTAQAHKLWMDLGGNAEQGPHEDRPAPSIAAVATLTNYLAERVTT